MVVNWGDHGMGQGGTLSWWRDSLYPGWLQGNPTLFCTMCPAFTPARHSLPYPPSQRVSSHDAELDTRPQREALLCTVSYCDLHSAPPAGLLADTHSGLVTYKKMRDQVPPPAINKARINLPAWGYLGFIYGSSLNKPSNTQEK